MIGKHQKKFPEKLLQKLREKLLKKFLEEESSVETIPRFLSWEVPRGTPGEIAENPSIGILTRAIGEILRQHLTFYLDKMPEEL